MKSKYWVGTAALMATVCAIQLHLLKAQEPSSAVRASPHLIREHIASHPVLIPTAVHSVRRTIQDLHTLANDLEKAGNRTDSARLKSITGEIVRRVEQEISERKSAATKLNEEIDELKHAIEE